MTKKKTRRQELSDFAFNGYLRSCLEIHATGLSEDAINLAVDVIERYCKPGNKKTKR